MYVQERQRDPKTVAMKDSCQITREENKKGRDGMRKKKINKLKK